MHIHIYIYTHTVFYVVYYVQCALARHPTDAASANGRTALHEAAAA